jgi:mannosyltransferase
MTARGLPAGVEAPMDPTAEPRPSDKHWLLVLTALTGLAAALRFWRLGYWGFEGDEVFTLNDSIRLQPHNPRPLLYWLNHYAIGAVRPLDELGLRLLPALFGVLAVPTLFLVGRRLVGTRAALFASILLVFSPLHLYHSQYARYWSLVFLLSAVYPFAIYFGLRDRSYRMLGLGMLTGVLAVLAHPVALLPVGGLIVWLLTQVRRQQLVVLWGQKSVRWGAGLVTLLTGVTLVRFVPMLLGWVTAHDEKKRLPDHLLSLPGRPGVKQIGLLLAYLDGLTLPLVLAAAIGVYLLWLRRDRSLALLLACLFVVPVGFLLLLSFRTAVSVTYMISTAPVVFLAAGVFLDRLASLDWELRPRWLLSATVAALIIAAGAPTLISQYRDGRRQDFRGVAQWLHQHLEPGDLLYSDQFRTVTLYLPGTQVHHLSADSTALTQSLHQLQAQRRGATLWIVAPYSAQGGYRTTPKLNAFKNWIYQNCQLREAIGVARLDFRQNELQIYRCPPATPTSEAAIGDTLSPLRASNSR